MPRKLYPALPPERNIYKPDGTVDMEQVKKQIAVEKMAKLQGLVDKQAEDDGLWFVAQTAPEAYLQQELRRLHAAIESE